MLNLPVIITPLRTYLYDQTKFWMEVICLQHLLIEYLEKYNFLKIVDANSIFADVKSIIQLSDQHFFCRREIVWARKTEYLPFLSSFHLPPWLTSYEQLLRKNCASYSFFFGYFETKLQSLKIEWISKIFSMSSSEEKWIKKFIDTSCVKLIISEEATAGALEKALLKVAFLKFATWNLQLKFLKNTYAENRF